MPQITSTITNGLASLPARTTAYYLIVWVEAIGNGVTSNRLASPIIFTTGKVWPTPNNIEGWDSWSEVISRLTVLGINFSKLIDPALPK